MNVYAYMYMIEVIFTPVYIGIIVYRLCHTLVLQTYTLYILLFLVFHSVHNLR